MDALPRSRSLVDRMRGAALFDVATYEDVEHDRQATGQAAVVVALAAVTTAVGQSWRGGPGVFTALVSMLGGWAVWAGITYVVGTRLFAGRATWGELLRTLGFAQAPGVLMVAAIVPVLGGIVRVVVSIWLLATMVVAIRQALDVDTGKAILTGMIGWFGWLVTNWLVAAAFGIRLL